MAKLVIKEKVQGRIGKMISLAPNIGLIYHSNLRTLNKICRVLRRAKKTPRSDSPRGACHDVYIPDYAGRL
jgi:hypothetical protein